MFGERQSEKKILTDILVNINSTFETEEHRILSWTLASPVSLSAVNTYLLITLLV